MKWTYNLKVMRVDEDGDELKQVGPTYTFDDHCYMMARVDMLKTVLEEFGLETCVVFKMEALMDFDDE